MPPCDVTPTEYVAMKLTLAGPSPSPLQTVLSPPAFHTPLEKSSSASTNNDTASLTAVSQSCEGELRFSEQMSAPVSARHSGQDIQRIESPSSDHALEHRLDSGNLPLLSPFRTVKDEQPLPSTTIGNHSANLQQAFEGLSSSPMIPPTSSDPPYSVLPFTANVLQSPFQGSLKGAPSSSEDLSSSAMDGPLPTHILPTDKSAIQDASIEESEVRTGTDTPSDPGENPSGVQSTRNMHLTTSDMMVSSGTVFSQSMDDKLDLKEAGSDDLIELDVAKGAVDPSCNSTAAPVCKAVSVANEPPSMSAEVVSSPHRSASASPAMHDVPLQSQSHEAFRQSDNQDRRTKKRPCGGDDVDRAPVPKRMTLASQKRQQKKLASPFRSPLLSRPDPGNITIPSRSSQLSLPSAPRGYIDEDVPSTPLRNTARPILATNPRSNPPILTSRFGTTKAASQFKSPLKLSSTPDSSSRTTSSRTIQDLDRKVQFLKRAIKIKQNEDEDKLEQLVQKWRRVGREAAWELWQIVRDNDESSDAAYPGTAFKSSTGMSTESWGWAGTSGPGQTSATSNWGWDEPRDKEMLEDDVRSEELESPTKHERELFQSLRKKPTVPRTSMLPPTPRGAYFEQAANTPAYDNCNEATEETEEKSSQEETIPEKRTKSLGTMLHQLGIAHETLGWVEDEGDFVDT